MLKYNSCVLQVPKQEGKPDDKKEKEVEGKFQTPFLEITLRQMPTCIIYRAEGEAAEVDP